MADIAYGNDGINYSAKSVRWRAIWAGVFIFAAIWSVFGVLGIAVFASNASPNAAAPVTGQSTRMAVWATLLTIIAMYVSSRETGRLAAVNNRHDGLVHGMTMFGMSVVAAIVLTTLAGAALSGGRGVQGTVHSGYLLGIFADLGWSGFVALLLGWLAAMAGGSQGVTQRSAPTNPNVHEIRPAA